MSDQQVPTAPNYSPFVNAYNNLANYAQTQGQSAMDWAKGQIASNTDLAKQVASGALDMGSSLYGAAKTGLGQAADLTTQGIQALKDQYAKYTDPARKAADMGAAGAQAAQGDEAARQASLKQLEGFGIDPSAVRYGGLDQGARLQSAATRVGAENIAGRQDDALADQTTQEILGEGNQLNTAGTSQAQGGGALSTGALTGSLANTGSGYTGLGTGLTWTQPQATALGGGAGVLNTGFQNQAEADKIANASSSGIGSLLGAGLGAMGKGGALAEGGALAFLADGGVVPEGGAMFGGVMPSGAVPVGPGGNSPVAAGGPGTPVMTSQMPVPSDISPTSVQAGQNAGNFTGTGNSFSGDMTYFQGGGEVPLNASPSRGAVTDDVAARGPSGAIRLDGGEFVLPKDVVSWEGEKSLQNLIQKARAAKQQATARPRIAVPGGAVPTGMPPPQQSPQRGAIPA